MSIISMYKRKYMQTKVEGKMVNARNISLAMISKRFITATVVSQCRRESLTHGCLDLEVEA